MSSFFRDLSNNQLSGPLPTPITSRQLASGFLSLAKNYFYGNATVVAGGLQFCPSLQTAHADFTDPSARVSNPALLLNCLSYSATSACTVAHREVQRTAQACAGFCGVTVGASGVCGGKGGCYLQGSSGVPSCLCQRGYKPDTATAMVGGQNVTYATCSLDPQSECCHNTIPSPPFSINIR